MDIFFPDFAFKLPEYTRINDYAIKLVDDEQPSYKPIYSLKLVELEIRKAYIETNLANGFIKLSKLLTGALILFDQKSESFLLLCVDYQGLNAPTINNWYPLSPIGESLGKLERAKQFTQLNLTNIYHQIKIHKENKWKTAFKT